MPTKIGVKLFPSILLGAVRRLRPVHKHTPRQTPHTVDCSPRTTSVLAGSDRLASQMPLSLTSVEENAGEEKDLDNNDDKYDETVKVS